MNTFSPYSDFKKSASCLDNKRLCKQRVEAWQIYLSLTQKDYGWKNHPAVKMWKGFEHSLLLYGWFICDEWKRRGFKDSLHIKFIDSLAQNYAQKNPVYPFWLKSTRFIKGMRSNLLRKNKEHYSKLGWNEPDNLPYYWPVKTKELNF